MNTTGIEWVRTYAPDGTWTPGFSSNPVRVVDTATGKAGWHCVKQGPECLHCYAETINGRWGTGRPYTADQDAAVTWVLIEAELAAWRKYEAAVVAGKKPPAKVFPGDMTDLFHRDVPDAFLDAIGAGVADCPHLLFLFLTKRAQRGSAVMTRWVAQYGRLPNLGFGVSVGTAQARWRIPYLLRVPTAIRFVSCEPLLEALDLRRVPHQGYLLDVLAGRYGTSTTISVPFCYGMAAYQPVNWVITGGESGGHHRPFDPDWARSLRDQCRATAVPFFFKQHGGRTPKAGGRLLDGCEWNEFPAGRTAVAA